MIDCEPIREKFYDSISPEPNSGCWLWTKGCFPFGHGAIYLGRKNLKAHRVSWMLHKGLIPEGMWVLHKCDIPQCCNPDHLYLGTVKDNARDCLSRGRWPKGSQNGASKLNDELAMQIFSDPRSTRIIAAEFGLSQACVNQIKTKRYWKHIHAD